MDPTPVKEDPSPGRVKLEPMHDISSMSHLPTLPIQHTSERDHGLDNGGSSAMIPASGVGGSMHQEQEQETDYLERLCTEDDPEVLETGVSVALPLLSQLQDIMQTHDNAETAAWLKSITELRESANKPPRTVVGVVGNTGAGKSSVINALLDEERLLPTNCLRACTASPTEISFNYSDSPQELYRAEIEFISTEDWIRELDVLYTDLLDGSGEVSRDATNMDSDAGVAYAKMKAVYPQMTREMIAQAEPRDLANKPAVRAILGTVRTMKEHTSKELYKRMQHYVDYKEKSTGPVDHRKKAGVEMEYWPLIKVVRIYTKADALSTGAVIVDLPGVQDSNAARAAVAASYMRTCTGLWICAPITRAVDDKTAKTLLGDSFKRQLKYDGTYSSVSFICSKTDDISITEAADSLGLDEDISESWAEAEDLNEKRESLQYKIKDLKGAKALLAEQLDDCENATEQWEELQSRLRQDDTVYAPSTGSKKRKRGGRPAGSRKNRESSDDDWEASESDSSDKENSQSAETREPLTEDDVESKLTSLRARRKEIREERRSLDSQIGELRDEIASAKNMRDAILAKVKAVCIAGRNNYSREAIKLDFAMGIKELDQENAMDEGDANFDPDQDIRDYDAVARSLPVFCVSARAYQKLCGRLAKDNFQSQGFPGVADTEIPKLQQHAKKLTEASRAHSCRHFLNTLSQLINSMKLWSSTGATNSYLTGDEKDGEEKHLKTALANLEKEIQATIEQAMTLVQKTLQDKVYKKWAASMPEAVQAANATAAGWSAPRQLGGLHFSTYRATVRRDGVYAGASGARDFNQELFDPVSKKAASGWEQAFQRKLPTILQNFAKETQAKLHAFHQATKTRADQQNINVVGLITLTSQLVAHTRRLQSLPADIQVRMTDLQREANREAVPVVCQMMGPAYQICAAECGIGCYARMKTAMANHVDQARFYMFEQATQVVRGRLESICEAVRGGMSETVISILKSMFVDYMRVIVGAEIDPSTGLSPAVLNLRKRLTATLADGDKLFAPVLGEECPVDNLTVSHKEELTNQFSTNIGAPREDPESGNKVAPDDMMALDTVKTEPVSDEALAPALSDNPDASGIKRDMLHQTDDMMQAHIQEQTSAGDAAPDYDPFASDDEFPDIEDLIKREK
ncbi:hypothetical protein GGR57DRAFT_452090 [Xylariaceae sp. FL1272]|nr:hypothetical protein GGR57DRAFT_452090 [Xylariaceae sp. FL1272]